MTDTKSSPQKNIDQTDVVLRVENLVKHYPIKSGVFGRANATIHAVEGVSFELHRGETLGIVGESGCGKSTAGKCILRLTDPTSGEVMLDGKDFTKLSGTALKDARQKMKLIFQDPYSSLNPRMTVMDIIGEPIDIAKTYATRSERDARIEEVMQEVGLDLAFKYRYPHEFSGGQRQRIAIARAAMNKSAVLILDEPTVGLDQENEAHVISALENLMQNRTTLMITHDLALAAKTDRILFINNGTIEEQGNHQQLLAQGGNYANWWKLQLS